MFQVFMCVHIKNTSSKADYYKAEQRSQQHARATPPTIVIDEQSPALGTMASTNNMHVQHILELFGTMLNNINTQHSSDLQNMMSTANEHHATSLGSIMATLQKMQATTAAAMPRPTTPLCRPPQFPPIPQRPLVARPPVTPPAGIAVTPTTQEYRNRDIIYTLEFMYRDAQLIELKWQITCKQRNVCERKDTPEGTPSEI
jgi:hypothetical protein